MDGDTPGFSTETERDDTWQAPQLTVLGSLASQTAALQVSNSDQGGSGSFAGDSGTI